MSEIAKNQASVVAAANQSAISALEAQYVNVTAGISDAQDDATALDGRIAALEALLPLPAGVEVHEADGTLAANDETQEVAAFTMANSGKVVVVGSFGITSSIVEGAAGSCAISVDNGASWTTLANLSIPNYGSEGAVIGASIDVPVAGVVKVRSISTTADPATFDYDVTGIEDAS
jgi:hypothetical protein